jgi:hypothetical protein
MAPTKFCKHVLLLALASSAGAFTGNRLPLKHVRVKATIVAFCLAVVSFSRFEEST